MNQNLHTAANRLQDWIQHQALPLWITKGINPNNKANYERLLASGEVDFSASTRVRVQSRQIFFYAAAYERGWCTQGKDIALAMMNFIRTEAHHPTATAGFSHLWDANWKIVDHKQDLYDHAFHLLALGWCYRISKDNDYILEAKKIIAHLDKQFGTANGGWIEGDYAYNCRRQNPHMHLFEAFMALYEASGDAAFLARASEMFGLFQAHFFDEKQQVLFEFFNDDWTLLEGIKGQQVEPGHMMEWVWLVDWYSRLTGRPVKHYTDALYNNGLAKGVDKSGLLFDAITPSGDIIDGNKRCWGITELIKASLVQIRNGHPAAENIAVKAVDDLFTYYLCAPTPGSYVDQRGINDEIVVDTAPASSLYHIIVAAMELQDHFAVHIK
ncbi:MAG: AGE family epimerase/isomerase [Cellvibrio sp.]|nr:AGE family epimerase/isomerase [Cellvibrio sp.]